MGMKLPISNFNFQISKVKLYFFSFFSSILSKTQIMTNLQYFDQILFFQKAPKVGRYYKERMACRRVASTGDKEIKLAFTKLLNCVVYTFTKLIIILE